MTETRPLRGTIFRSLDWVYFPPEIENTIVNTILRPDWEIQHVSSTPKSDMSLQT